MDTVSVVIAHKQIDDFILIAAAPCGQGYKKEWGGNLEVGDEERHVGFNKGAQIMGGQIQEYIRTHNLDGKKKLWLSGFSRAAVSNLTAADMIESGLSEEELFHGPQKIRRVTISGPIDVEVWLGDYMVKGVDVSGSVYTSDYAEQFEGKESMDAVFEKYPNVFIMRNGDDTVTCLPMDKNFRIQIRVREPSAINYYDVIWAPAETFSSADTIHVMNAAEEMWEKIASIKSDIDFRTAVFSVGMFLITVLFAVYNGFLGIRYMSLWHGSICVYFILLSLIRIYILLSEKNIEKHVVREMKNY